MPSKLERYRKQHEKKLARLQKAQSDMEAMERKLQEEENTQIIAAVRSYAMTPEDLSVFLQMIHEGKTPQMPKQTEENQNEHEKDASM